jgi:hypothetical protein
MNLNVHTPWKVAKEAAQPSQLQGRAKKNIYGRWKGI